MEHMLAFVYVAYRIMALPNEIVAILQDTWIERLGDLGQYRMATDNEVEGIYVGLELVDCKIWQALIALHRTLLREHHDLSLGSKHPQSRTPTRQSEIMTIIGLQSHISEPDGCALPLDHGGCGREALLHSYLPTAQVGFRTEDLASDRSQPRALALKEEIIPSQRRHCGAI